MTEDSIQDLSQKFLKMYPTKDLDLKTILDHLSSLDYEESEHYQKQILCKTLHHSVAQKFPPTVAYRQRFLKLLIMKIEEINVEVCGDIYEAYTDLLSFSCRDSDGDSCCYRTYSFMPEFMITLKETQKIISEGTTGMFTWQASHVLSDWCLKEKVHFSGKDILELGAGLGLTGLSIIKGCRPLSYTFTDLHSTVLKTLKENVLINLGEGNTLSKNLLNEEAIDDNQKTEEDFRIHYKESLVSVKRLDWTTDNIIDSFDVIIAADVVYDTTIISPLVQILKQSLEKKCGAFAYVASTIRNEETMNYFRRTLDLNDVKISSESHHCHRESPSQPESSVVLMHLKL